MPDENATGAGVRPIGEATPPQLRRPVLARSAHDRIAHRRKDEAFVEAAWGTASSRVLVVSPAGTARVSGAGSLIFESPDALTFNGDVLLLGEHGGTVYFALLADGTAQTGPAEAAADWQGLRALAVDLDDLDVGLLTTAVALQQWHQRHTHCPRCGTQTLIAQSGWTRVCPQDGSEHFPRTDPAVIMLVTDGQDRCLLARGPDWPEGRLSVLAGFVEAGESAEAAVVREVAEEVGVAVSNVRYIASQPHPFPASLMLGFTAELDGDPLLRLDPAEIAEAGWFTRDEVRRAVDWGAEPPDATGPLRGLPSHMSIARQLIDGWLAR